VQLDYFANPFAHRYNCFNKLTLHFFSYEHVCCYNDLIIVRCDILLCCLVKTLKLLLGFVRKLTCFHVYLSDTKN